MIRYFMSRRRFIKLSGTATASLLMKPIFPSIPSDKIIRFGIISDSHYADRDITNNRYYRESISKMEEAIETMNSEKLDFIIHLGDFKDQDSLQRKKDTLRYLKSIEAEYAKFKGPRYHCIGNHDVDSITKKMFLQNIENTGIANDKKYYSFDINNFHFIVLDANNNDDGSDHYHKDGKSNWQDPNITEEEFTWFENDLRLTNLPTVVFNHQTIFEYSRDGYRFHINQPERMQNLLEDSNKVLAVFQGHVHEEIHKEINGIHYITQLGMVDGSGLENNSFSIVTINQQQIIIDGYKRSSDIRYSL